MGDPPFPCDDAGELSGWTAPIGDFDAIKVDDIKAAYSFAREFLEALISFRGFLHNWREEVELWRMLTKPMPGEVVSQFTPGLDDIYQRLSAIESAAPKRLSDQLLLLIEVANHGRDTAVAIYDDEHASMFRAVRGLTRDIVTVAAGAWFSAKNNDGTKQLRSRIAGHRKTIEYVDRWFDENLPILKRCESRLSHEFRNAVAWVRSQRPSDPATEDAHSDDFRSVRWQGQTYSFTAKQAPAIKLLWEHREKGTTDVADETLLLAIDEQAPPANLRTLFRGHPAWSTMIVAGGSKGTHRLA